jgi:hypothetical protein
MTVLRYKAGDDKAGGRLWGPRLVHIPVIGLTQKKCPLWWPYYFFSLFSRGFTTEPEFQALYLCQLLTCH